MLEGSEAIPARVGSNEVGGDVDEVLNLVRSKIVQFQERNKQAGANL
jgi:hypothetical protein